MKNDNDLLADMPVPTAFFKLAIPAIAAQLINILYNLVDKMFIGRIPNVGKQALAAIMLILGRSIMLLFGASQDTITYAVDYMNIYCLGTLFTQLTLGLNAFITAQGKTLISMCNVAVLVVDDGQIVQRGTHTELVAVPGKYKDFVDIGRLENQLRRSEKGMATASCFSEHDFFYMIRSWR